MTKKIYEGRNKSPIDNVLCGNIGLRSSNLLEGTKVHLYVAINAYLTYDDSITMSIYDYLKAVSIAVVNKIPSKFENAHRKQMYDYICQFKQLGNIRAYQSIKKKTTGEWDLRVNTALASSLGLIGEERPVTKYDEMIAAQSKEAEKYAYQIQREHFIIKSEALHPGKYNYSLVNTETRDANVNIICNKCGETFTIRMSSMLRRGEHCPKCRHSNKKKSTESFASEINALYGEGLYTMETEYENNRTAVTCKCHKHSLIFRRTPQNLLRGYGCPECMKEQCKTFANTVQSNYDKSRTKTRWTTEQYIEEAEKVHGKGVYDYSKVNYINNDTDILIAVKGSDEFYPVRPYEHLRSIRDNPLLFGAHPNAKTSHDKFMYFVARADSVYPKKYYYHEPIGDFNQGDEVMITCPLHGDFKRHTTTFLSGAECEFCNPDVKTLSKGERRVKDYLKARKIKFESHYNVKNTYLFSANKRLELDFYLPALNTVIEFNGKQHYQHVSIYHKTQEDFERQQERDVAVRMYCKENSIRLIEIPETELNNIKSYLDERL